MGDMPDNGVTFWRTVYASTLHCKLVANGATTYGKSDHFDVYVVPEGVSHSDAWRAVKGE